MYIAQYNQAIDYRIFRQFGIIFVFIDKLGIKNIPKNIFIDKNGIVKRIEDGISYKDKNRKLKMGKGKEFEEYIKSLLQPTKDILHAENSCK